MQVKKRDGSLEDVSFDKVLERIRKAAQGLAVNPDILAQQVLARIVNGIRTSELDELTARMADSLSTNHPDWGTLASRIAVSNHHKNTPTTMAEAVAILSKQALPKTGEVISYMNHQITQLLAGPLGVRIDGYIKYERDYLFDYFGLKTLEKSYLLKDASMRVVERPQHMWMRVALCLWGENLDRVFETYDYMSQKYFTHATPTLFNAGTPRQQMSSCFLMTMKEDSIEGIYNTLKDCATISKHAGGIGLSLHNVRARGSLIRGTNGVSNGLVPMLRNFNATARYVDQGGGKRNGSFAIYLEPWHADIEDFLKLKLNSGAEEDRARDLFYGLWINDLFMERVEQDSTWSLFCPSEAPGLADVWGPAFNDLYMKYEVEGRARKTVQARTLWFQILDTQVETGTPYLLYKDAANAKSNQQNLGTIKSSNLCTEIMEFSSPEETAVCNLASIALPSYLNVPLFGSPMFDYAGLRKATATIVRNLNRVIDINFYPTPETRTSNMRHRPIGIGVQGLADVFASLQLAWDSPQAADLNQRIFEHIYYSAAATSAEIAVEEGPYSTFAGSPMSKGILQPDMWGVTPLTHTDKTLDWAALRKKVQGGIRNSLLVAPMPTASTSQILGFNECFEPFTANIYSRRTLAGDFIVVNKSLVKELIGLGLWNDAMKQSIMARNGSVQGLATIPEELQARYKTAWEIPQKVMIDMAAARGAFICQSQSLNLFIADATKSKLTSMHFYAWKAGLKTGCYYLRTKAPVAAQKFTVDPRLMAALEANTEPTDDGEYASDSDEEVPPPPPPKPETRQEKIERLSREYEEELVRAREAAASGEGCQFCSS
jgi:ribonucleoside-diphosphate reductase alpha chain